MPRTYAAATASVREYTSSFSKSEQTWRSTVFGERCNRCAAVRSNSLAPAAAGWTQRPSIPQLASGGQRVGVAGQKPAAVGLFAVYGDPMSGQLRCFSADARRYR